MDAPKGRAARKTGPEEWRPGSRRLPGPARPPGRAVSERASTSPPPAFAGTSVLGVNKEALATVHFAAQRGGFVARPCYRRAVLEAHQCCQFGAFRGGVQTARAGLHIYQNVMGEFVSPEHSAAPCWTDAPATRTARVQGGLAGKGKAWPHILWGLGGRAPYRAPH